MTTLPNAPSKIDHLELNVTTCLHALTDAITELNKQSPKVRHKIIVLHTIMCCYLLLPLCYTNWSSLDNTVTERKLSVSQPL